MTIDLEPVAWRVRRLSDDPEEWQLRPAGAALDFGNPKRWEVQGLVLKSDAEAAARERDVLRADMQRIVEIAGERAALGFNEAGRLESIKSIARQALQAGEKG